MIYDIIKLQILSYYSTEFHKFFCAINCCSYKTHFRIFAKKVFDSFIFAKKFDQCERNFSNFFAKRFVRWTP